MNICHSIINEYPPNPVVYPKFYNCKEHIFILNPGDLLYIPPRWFHWVHSYGDENIAVSFPEVEYNNLVYNDFSLGKPFIYNLNPDKDKYNFLNLSLNDLNTQDELKTLLSKTTNVLIPVVKNTSDVRFKNLKLNEILTLRNKGKYNMLIGQNFTAIKNNKIKPPDFILDSFPGTTFQVSSWISLPNKNNDHIDSGLHYDYNHNCLVQIKGTKVVRMYSPDCLNNFYLKPHNILM